MMARFNHSEKIMMILQLLYRFAKAVDQEAIKNRMLHNTNKERSGPDIKTKSSMMSKGMAMVIQ